MKHRQGNAQPDQRLIVVRVDCIIYIQVAAIAFLVVASVVWPGRVELALVGLLCSAMAGTLGGWLTFVRVARRNGAGNGEANGGGACTDGEEQATGRGREK